MQWRAVTSCPSVVTKAVPTMGWLPSPPAAILSTTVVSVPTMRRSFMLSTLSWSTEARMSFTCSAVRLSSLVLERAVHPTMSNAATSTSVGMDAQSAMRTPMGRPMDATRPEATFTPQLPALKRSAWRPLPKLMRSPSLRLATMGTSSPFTSGSSPLHRLTMRHEGAALSSPSRSALQRITASVRSS